MSTALRSVLIGTATFVVIGVASFFLLRSVDPLATDPQTLPELDAPIPVLETVPFEGDPTEVAIDLAEYERDSLQAAYAAGLPGPAPTNSQVVAAPLSESSGGSSSSTDTPTTEPSDTTTAGAPSTTIETDAADAGDPSPGSVPSPADPPPGEDRVIDLCTESDVEGCPEGVAGTVLAIRALEPFAGIATFLPAELGEGYTHASPECPATPAEEGKAHFGVSTNRPAVITMRYRSLEWVFGEYAFPETTFTLTTADADETGWNEWFADESAGNRDERAWINHCFTLELPPRDDYVAFFTFQDKYDSSVTAVNWQRPVDFYVPAAGGAEPGSQRRPTAVFHFGLDDLYVSATHEPGQEFRTVAIPGSDTAACVIAGDEGDIGRRDGARIDGAVFGGERSSATIDPAITGDPAYPYFPTYTEVATDLLRLRSGTNYVLCNYWLNPGPSFDARTVEEIETFIVSTPEAYAPTVVIHGLTDIYRDPTAITVSVAHCGTKTFDLAADGAIVSDRTGARISAQTPETLCTLDSHLSEIDRRGLRVDSTVVTDVERQSGSAYIRTNLECGPGPCDPNRLSEMVLVPVADIASDGSECPSDPFTGCLSDGAFPAGKAIIELVFTNPGGGNGLDSWSIGTANPIQDAERELPPNPQYDITIDYEYATTDPGDGATATVTILADRPVSMQVTAITYDEGYAGRCSLVAPTRPAFTAALAESHTFELTPLCLGATYRLTVEGLDEAGNMGEFVGRIYGRYPSTPPNEVDLLIPTARLNTSITVAVNAPDNDFGHTVYIHPAFVRSGDYVGTFSNKLGWTWPTIDRTREARDGWRFFGVDGRANGCAQPGAGELNVRARRTSTGIPLWSGASVALEDIDVALTVELFSNHRPGGIYGECAVNAPIARYELNRVVTLGDLLEGIEITSDDGSVVFTLETTRDGTISR